VALRHQEGLKLHLGGITYLEKRVIAIRLSDIPSIDSITLFLTESQGLYWCLYTHRYLRGKVLCFIVNTA